VIIGETVHLAQLSVLLLAGGLGLDAREGALLEIILLVPAGELAIGATRPELMRSIDEALLERTSLRAEPIDAALLAETCPEGTFACFSRRLIHSELYAVISVVPIGDDAHRLAATLLDTRAARACATQTNEESCVLSKAVVASQPAQIIDARDVRSRIRSFVLETARPAFVAAKVWEPYGVLRIEFAEDGFEVQLDGKTIGSTAKTLTYIEHVLPGPRKVQLSRGAVATRAELVLVERAKTTTVAMMLELDAHPLRTALFYTGAGAALAGAVITTVAAIEAGSRGSFVACAGASVSCSERFIGSADVDPRALEASRGPRGVLLAPLGLALFGGGAAWSVGSLLGDDADLPIIEVLIGAGLMVATYTTGALLGGGAP
jgi:hypothetical protein